MPLLKKPFGRHKEEVQTVETDQYIDLGALNFEEENPLSGKGMIKIRGLDSGGAACLQW
jgi:hypothetical protein